MGFLRAFCIFVSLAIIADPGLADQTDPRLGPLFEQLKSESQPTEAVSIEQEIWAIWLEPTNPAAQSFMKSGLDAMSRGNNRAALDAFDQVISIAPGFAEGWNKRATVHFLCIRPV